MRNPHRSRIAGVCAGLSDYTGVSQTLFRVLFLISLLFGGFGFWVYLIFWVALPARDTVPISDASLTLRWEIFQLGRLTAKLHRTQKPTFADQAQLAYEAIRRLAPRIDQQQPTTLDPETARLALIEFPSQLNQILRAGHLMRDAAQDERIEALQMLFLKTCDALIEASRVTLTPLDWHHPSPESPEVEMFRARFQALKRQLASETSEAITDRLNQLESHLNQLLQVPETEMNDLGPIPTHEIRRIAFDFLPETLETYIKVQGPWSKTRMIRDQKTAEDLFREQLDLMDRTLEVYLQAVHERNARSLLIQGHFLRDKFAMPPAEDPDKPSGGTLP